MNKIPTIAIVKSEIVFSFQNYDFLRGFTSETKYRGIVSHTFCVIY